MTLDLFQKEQQHTNGPVTVLGKTFANDEERRAYFREELRKKLPELKEIEGFPIGEDEDIINLSDPPFYTACPNPWINDFIAEWEEEKKQLEKEGKRVPDFEVTEPYAADVSEGKNNPIYNAHSYHTKVPHPAIMRYIIHYTQPGDVVFDGFAGTGMTGVAASMCGNPDADIKAKIEKDSPNAKWGKRNAICSDLSPIASFITKVLNNNIFSEKFNLFLEQILNKINIEFEWMYVTKHTNGDFGIIDNTIWSQVFSCNNCNTEYIFWDEAVENSKVKSEFSCPNCKMLQTKKNANILFETKYDSIDNTSVKRIKEVPVTIKYTYKGKSYEKRPDDYDIQLLAKIDSYIVNLNFLNSKINKGDEISRLLNHNIDSVHKLFYKRTLIYINELINLAKIYNEFSYELLFYITAVIQRASRLFRWSSNHAGPLMGTYYIASLTLEVAPKNLIKNKRNISKDLSIIGNSNKVINQISSATSLQTIKNSSVDYIFTDPPFGSNLMYSELNLIYESILSILTDNDKEAIESKTQNKNLFVYQNLMQYSFKEYFRILKPGRWMTVEFSNTSATVWNGIQTALVNAGFIIANVAALDKKQGSFKAVTTASAVKQDLVISCYKPSSEFDTKFQQSQHSPMGVWDFVEEHLSHLPIHLVKDNATTAVVERSAKILFDRLIAFYVQRSLPVPIDAGKFQEGLKERFVERDGMYFTQEQVEEYERKKAEVPEFIQMSLFVGSEQDAVYWLRQLLEKEPKTEQDLHPLWMREVAGNMRKGDTLPEMRQILEENFLKDDTGKWYVPDAENEADLEKLRNKRLLKIFEDYKIEAAKPKGKLKEVRVEALRVGFKQCYQDKDFKTIVTIGDRIPNNLLMEDEVLLQFYDIAAAKI